MPNTVHASSSPRFVSLKYARFSSVSAYPQRLSPHLVSSADREPSFTRSLRLADAPSAPPSVDPLTTVVARGERPALRGWQDKGARGRAPTGSGEPSPVTKVARSSLLHTTVARSQNPHPARERLERASIWMRPGVKSTLKRLASQDKLSFSAACSTALEVYARAKIHEQEEALFEPRFRQITREENRALGNRLIFFEMRNAIAAEQTRILTADLYTRLLKKEGVPQDKIQEKLDKTYQLARANVLRKTPQLKTLLDEWWRATEDQVEGSEDGKTSGGKAGTEKSND